MTLISAVKESDTVAALPKTRDDEKSKQRAVELRRKLREAYERGATSEATRFLIEEFAELRKAYEKHIKALRKHGGL